MLDQKIGNRLKLFIAINNPNSTALELSNIIFYSDIYE
jgi:hypothetical protein